MKANKNRKKIELRELVDPIKKLKVRVLILWRFIE